MRPNEADFRRQNLLSIFGLIGLLNRLRSLLALWKQLVRVFEGMLLMRVTTVASVTEQNVFSKKNRRKQLLRAPFDRYVIVHPTTRPHVPSITRHINKNQRNTLSDAC